MSEQCQLTRQQATNGYDGSMMNGLQTLVWWKSHFNNPTDSQLGLLNAIMSVGGVVSLPIFPYVADYLGRRIGIIIGCIICCGGVVLQSIGTNIGMFIAARYASFHLPNPMSKTYALTAISKFHHWFRYLACAGLLSHAGY